MPSPPPTLLLPSQYEAIATFRFELRRFLAFSEAEALAAGLPAQQHQAMLAIAGHADVEPPSVKTVADRLLIAPNSAAELVARMVEAGLLTKIASPRDRRRTELKLTNEALALLHQLTTAHLRELENLEPVLARALGRLSTPHADAETS